jgi:hypothetical protein
VIDRGDAGTALKRLRPGTNALVTAPLAELDGADLVSRGRRAAREPDSGTTRDAAPSVPFPAPAGDGRSAFRAPLRARGPRAVGRVRPLVGPARARDARRWGAPDASPAPPTASGPRDRWAR